MYTQDTFYLAVFMVTKKNLLTWYSEVKEQFTLVFYSE